MYEPLTSEQIERRKALAAVLRGNEYTRGSGSLEGRRRDDAPRTLRHCCLGVAARESEKDGVKLKNVHPDGALAGALLSTGNPEAAEFYGFTYHEEVELASRNDASQLPNEPGMYCYSWDEIADDIETGRFR